MWNLEVSEAQVVLVRVFASWIKHAIEHCDLVGHRDEYGFFCDAAELANALLYSLMYSSASKQRVRSKVSLRKDRWQASAMTVNPLSRLISTPMLSLSSLRLPYPASSTFMQIPHEHVWL